MKMKAFFPLQQKPDILHAAYLVPHAIRSKAHKYNVDPNQIHRWKASWIGLDEEEGQQQVALFTSFKGRAKILNSGKIHIDNAHYIEQFALCLTPCTMLSGMFMWWYSLWNWRGYLIHQNNCLSSVSISLAGLQVCILFTALSPI